MFLHKREVVQLKIISLKVERKKEKTNSKPQVSLARTTRKLFGFIQGWQLYSKQRDKKLHEKELFLKVFRKDMTANG